MTASNVTRAQSAGRLLELIVMRLISEALHVAAALGVADLLASGPKSAEQLAHATRSSEQSLRRVLRALVGIGVFAQDSSGRFLLAPMGELLRRDVEDRCAPRHCSLEASGVLELTDCFYERSKPERAPGRCSAVVAAGSTGYRAMLN